MVAYPPTIKHSSGHPLICSIMYFATWYRRVHYIICSLGVVLLQRPSRRRTQAVCYGGYMQCQTGTPSGEMPTHVLRELNWRVQRANPRLAAVPWRPVADDRQAERNVYYWLVLQSILHWESLRWPLKNRRISDWHWRCWRWLGSGLDNEGAEQHSKHSACFHTCFMGVSQRVIAFLKLNIMSSLSGSWCVSN